MTKRKNNKILTCFATLFLSFIFILNTNAQSISKATDDLVIKLKQKVLLSQNQADEVEKSLNEYFNSPTDDNRKALENKIESLLEEKQKMKYNVIKKDWWESVSKELSRVKRQNE